MRHSAEQCLQGASVMPTATEPGTTSAGTLGGAPARLLLLAAIPVARCRTQRAALRHGAARRVLQLLGRHAGVGRSARRDLRGTAGRPVQGLPPARTGRRSLSTAGLRTAGTAATRDHAHVGAGARRRTEVYLRRSSRRVPMAGERPSASRPVAQVGMLPPQLAAPNNGSPDHRPVPFLGQDDDGALAPQLGGHVERVEVFRAGTTAARDGSR